MLQHKSLPLSDCQIKLDDSGGGRFVGYASVFGGVDSYGDTIIKGAYAYTLREHGKPKMFVNHDSFALPVGKWLTANEDDHGLLVEGELTPGMAQASDAHAALKHGTVDGLSIGYRLRKGDWEDTENGGRIIRKVSHVSEVSIVTFRPTVQPVSTSRASRPKASTKSPPNETLNTSCGMQGISAGRWPRQSPVARNPSISGTLRRKTREQEPP